MPKRRALLLDFCGTLAVEKRSRGAIYADAATQAGIEVSPERMTECMGIAHGRLPMEIGAMGSGSAFRYSRPWFEAFIEDVFVGQLGARRERLAKVQAELFARFTDAQTFRVFPGTRALIERARGLGLAVAVVSNWSDSLEELLGNLRLGPFDAILSSAVVGSEKPDRRIFEAALEGLGVSPAECLHVGDSLQNDIVGAQRLGIEAVLVDRSLGLGAVSYTHLRASTRFSPAENADGT